MNAIRFRFHPEKALSAIHHLVAAQPGVDLHAMLKSCYFGDKQHLNAHGRPIFGATYKAMRFGPVPLEIYEMAKGEALWLAELGLDAFPWELRGYRLSLRGNAAPDLSALSETDLEELDKALGTSTRMSFDARTAATHGPDWQAAHLGTMSYADMIEAGEDKGPLVEHLEANARFMRL